MQCDNNGNFLSLSCCTGLRETYKIYYSAEFEQIWRRIREVNKESFLSNMNTNFNNFLTWLKILKTECSCFTIIVCFQYSVVQSKFQYSSLLIDCSLLHVDNCTLANISEQGYEWVFAPHMHRWSLPIHGHLLVPYCSFTGQLSWILTTPDQENPTRDSVLEIHWTCRPAFTIWHLSDSSDSYAFPQCLQPLLGNTVIW